MEEKLQETEKTLVFVKTALDYVPDMVHWVNPDGRYLYANKTFSRILGYCQEEVPTLHVWDFDPKITPEIWPIVWEKGRIAGDASFETIIRTKDNRILPVQMRVIYTVLCGEQIAFVISQLIPEEKQSPEEELQAVLAQQEALLNNIPYITWLKDGDSQYIAVNDAFARFCNRKRDEVVGLTDFDLWSPEMAQRFRVDDQAMIADGEKVHFEAILQDPEGNPAWYEVFKTPIHFEPSSKLIIGTVGIAQDITARKEAEEALQLTQQELERTNEKLKRELHERKVLESQLIQSQKMESLGHMAAGIAHEINNPVAFTQSNLNTLCNYIDTFKTLISLYETLQDRHREDEIATQIESFKTQNDFQFILQDLDGLLLESREGLGRVKEIVNGLKTFARPEEPDLQEADINECLESALKIGNNELKYKCAVKKDFQPLPLLPCYPGQLNQVFLNLIVNAAQAIHESGEIKIRTTFENDHIVVAISDTGAGIAPEHLENIFNPFFTTKEVGQGTGLGLSISYGIIQKHGGRIEVCSELGHGSTFTVFLPTQK